MKYYLKYLGIILLLFSCNKDINPYDTSFEIYLDYWNETGTNPQIRFDELKSDQEIKIDFSQTFGGFALGQNETNVIIDNFRIVDQNQTNYSINNITAFEFRADTQGWKQDVEFKMDFTHSSSLSLVLVIDRSESLGTDFELVKEYANSFIDKVFEDKENVEIGIVDFADDIKYYPSTKNKSELKEYVANLKQGKFTSLYEATAKGLELLQLSNSQSKTLVVFTDGTDNNSNPKYDLNYLLTQATIDKTAPVSIFTIGLGGKGGVDKTVLAKLSAQGGTASYPENINQLKQVFQTLSGLVSTVYRLTYIRNQQVVSRNSPIKLKFLFKTI